MGLQVKTPVECRLVARSAYGDDAVLFQFEALNLPLPFFVAGQIAVVRASGEQFAEFFPGVYSIASAPSDWPRVDFVLRDSHNPKSMQNYILRKL